RRRVRERAALRRRQAGRRGGRWRREHGDARRVARRCIHEACFRRRGPMSWITIAKKEYLENVRNAWVIAVSALFLALTLLTSYLSRVTSGNLSGTPGFSSIGVTLNGLDSVGGFLLPILAITVGFATI